MRIKLLYILLFLLSLLLQILIAPIRIAIEDTVINGWQLAAMIGSILYFCLSFFVQRILRNKLSKNGILLAIIIGASIIQIPYRIAYFYPSIYSLPEFVLHILGIILGYYCAFFSSRKKQILFSAICIILCLYLSIYMYGYYNNKLNYGTFFGKITDENIYNFDLDMTDSTKIPLREFRGKYLVLDCWFTGCSSCYKEFPNVQELCNKYKDSKLIAIYSCHFRSEDEGEISSTGRAILEKRGYNNIPILSVSNDNPNKVALGLRVYPVVLIFNKESKLIYRGDIVGAEKLIEELINK